MKYIKGSVCAMLFILAATAAGLAFLHICDAVYLMDVRHYGLAESTGLTEEQIMDNYNAVMEYLSPFSQGEFDLPDLSPVAQPAGTVELAPASVTFLVL